MEIAESLKNISTENPFKKAELKELRNLINSTLEELENSKISEAEYEHDKLMNIVPDAALKFEAEASKITEIFGKDIGSAVGDLGYMFAEYYPYIVRNFGREVNGVNVIDVEEKDNLIPHNLKEIIDTLTRVLKNIKKKEKN